MFLQELLDGDSIYALQDLIEDLVTRLGRIEKQQAALLKALKQAEKREAERAA